MRLRDIFLVLLVVIIWGANFTTIKFGLEDLPPILLSAMRFVVVALPAVFFAPRPKTSILNVLGVGFFWVFLSLACYLLPCGLMRQQGCHL